MVSDGEDTPDDDEDEPPVSAAQTQALHIDPPEMVTPDICFNQPYIYIIQ